MNQNLCIFILIFLLSSETPAFALDFYYQNCSVPAICGRQIISFPFYIQGRQQDFCGYPGFQLSCHGGAGNDEEEAYPLLRLSGNDYIIHNISYESQTLVVSNALLSHYLNNSACTNLSLIHNLTLPNDQFKLAPNQDQFFLLYNCSPSFVVSFPKYKIGCNNTSVLALPRQIYLKLGGLVEFEKCGSSEVAVAHGGGYGNDEAAGMKEVLGRGFKMKWLAGDCSRCQRSGGLCGFNYTTHHFRCLCPDRTHAVLCRYDADKGPGTGNLVAKISIGAVAGLIFLIVIVCCLRRKLSSYRFLFFWKKQNQNRQIVETFLRSYGPLQVRRYSYSEVKKMTNSFKEKLGQGGYGAVYKGKLKDGCLVAVKVLTKLTGDGEEFINEVAAISRTSHVNVVALLGFCFEGSKRALIYEFMPNGSLEKFIFDSNTPNIGHDHLGWEALDQISLGVAQGLEYLHRGCSTRILHFDIKPHNILLDENFTPKISDFGLAKICNRKESIVSMLGARGTTGYIAPEVFSRNFGNVSHKSDVYSYGMMLSAMVGGRRNIDAEAENTSEIYFPHWIYKHLELDEELGLQSVANEEDKARARKMIIVSLWCIQTDPSKRPAMKEVIDMLEGSVDSLQIPPKPYLYSPPKSPADSLTTLVSIK
ncbi:LEAF RUST 10 DISEASE-RESISTANCE LOCUS RECEPTOR-LIKE PROTEIN KINASE-like 2.1 isoform X2 [Pyrus x bretschneideri]|uniref:LEAF RUST 10 DISEASE-RESISTANCE LOCUS RECEPTOR-LIKE PROTEIN KINASE-like 2.1 isoform X2 n=1 Tax=Pyrus x bretschneideri TaxID=225117 RepID=UPI00202EC508|nr:LEAF RUST 10 DISEASE-RESISTANCE LOCUS RECEPTOR-LIKE PROTEIN KINASE-like 2.1 isoform X2 [Pyrus x bretschneideri]